MQYDNAEDEDMGKKGRTFKKDRSEKSRETRKLKGAAGQRLYLECLQLVLRQQLAWLIGSQRLPLDLEQVVRDLWDVRIRGAPLGGDVAAAASDGSEPEMSVFSSQSENDASGTDGSELRYEGAQAQTWAWEGSRGWPNPRPLDTLALCYLGGLLLRCPMRVGQLQRWANGGQIPYSRAVRYPSIHEAYLSQGHF